MLVPELAIPAMAARLMKFGAPIAGAAAGGGATAAVQGQPIGPAAGRQAGYEVGGQAVSWPLRALGRRLVAPGVGTRAKAALEQTRDATLGRLDSALQQAQSTLRGSRASTAKSVVGFKETRRLADDAARQAEIGGKAQAEGIKAKWPGPPPGPPSATFSHNDHPDWGGAPMYHANVPAGHPLHQSTVGAGTLREHGIPVPGQPGVLNQPITAAGRATQQVQQVVEGPAQHSLDRLGKAVEEAAESGPAIPWTPIRDKVERMYAHSQPTVLAGEAAIPAQVQAQFGAATPAAKVKQLLADAGVALEESHPLPGVLGKLQQVEGESISFADAHKFKRLLDEAVNWDSPAKKQVQQITKGIRGTLRQAMQVHAPYNAATEAYRQTRPLFTTGLAKSITKSATTNPDALLGLIKSSEPTKLQMLKEVLTHHAESGGGAAGAAEGQEAWNSVRSAWTYDQLIKPGLEKFDAQLAKAHPEFLSTMFGDQEGKQVLGNLSQLADAYHTALATAAADVATHRGTASAAAVAAQRTADAGKLQGYGHAADVAAAKEARRGALPGIRAQEQAFKASSLVRPPGPKETGVHLAQVAIHGTTGYGSIRAIGHLIKGPKVKDLIHWAALSPARTQLVVKALTGPEPGMALTDLYRVVHGHEQPVSQPGGPPAAKPSALTPPPGPPRLPR